LTSAISLEPVREFCRLSVRHRARKLTEDVAASPVVLRQSAPAKRFPADMHWPAKAGGISAHRPAEPAQAELRRLMYEAYVVRREPRVGVEGRV